MTEIVKRRRGRVSTWKPETGDEIIERLTKGEPLAQIARSEHMPCLRTIYDWVSEHPDFAARFAQARRSGFDQIALDALRIADETPPTNANGGTDTGWVQHSKLRIETRLKLLAKWDPKRYGERLELTGDAENPISLQRIERVLVRSGE